MGLMPLLYESTCIGQPLSDLILNEGQQAALDAIVGGAEDFALHGAAGTGKTTVLQVAAKLLDQKRVIFLAPTNKALTVLQSKLPDGSFSRTIQSFLGVKRRIEEGVELFEVTSDGIQKAAQLLHEKEFDLVIVDESSMISSEIENALVSAISGSSKFVRCIWSGDKYQLPPPSGEKALSFWQPKYAVELAEVVRHGGAVLDYATRIRRDFEKLAESPEASKKGGSEILLLEEHKWEREFIEDVRKNGTTSRAICWKNASVNALSSSLRLELFGPDTALKWLPGEVLQFRKRYITPTIDQARFNNSSEVVVLETKDVTVDESIFQHFKLEYSTTIKGVDGVVEWKPQGTVHRLRVSRIDLLTGEKSEGYVDNVYTLPSVSPLKTSLSKVKQNLRRIKGSKYKYSPSEYKKAWNVVTAFEDYFASLGSAFVMTVHRSQGSTFDKTYIHKDIWNGRFRGAESLNPLVYTATTRSRIASIFSY